MIPYVHSGLVVLHLTDEEGGVQQGSAGRQKEWVRFTLHARHHLHVEGARLYRLYSRTRTERNVHDYRLPIARFAAMEIVQQPCFMSRDFIRDHYYQRHRGTRGALSGSSTIEISKSRRD